jgi:hypothetical protein
MGTGLESTWGTQEMHINISLEIPREQSRSRHRPEGQNDIYHGEIAYENVNWTAVAENSMQLWDVIYRVINLFQLYMSKKFIADHYGRTLRHEMCSWQGGLVIPKELGVLSSPSTSCRATVEVFSLASSKGETVPLAQEHINSRIKTSKTLSFQI